MQELVDEMVLNFGDIKFLLKGFESLSSFSNNNDSKNDVLDDCMNFCRLLNGRIMDCEKVLQKIIDNYWRRSLA